MFDIDTIKNMNNNAEEKAKQTEIPLKCSLCKNTWYPVLALIQNFKERLGCPTCKRYVSVPKRIAILASPLISMLNKRAIDIEELE